VLVDVLAGMYTAEVGSRDCREGECKGEYEVELAEELHVGPELWYSMYEREGR